MRIGGSETLRWPLFIIAVDLAAAGVAVVNYPALWTQPGALRFVLGPVGLLLVYAVLFTAAARARGQDWVAIRKAGWVFGLVTALIEVLDIGLENEAPARHGAAVSVAFMLAAFLLWGIAGARTAHSTGLLRCGVYAAIFASAICMLFAVGAGFVLEFWVVPPEPGYVVTSAEFHRSGWSDPRAFGLANTLDSGFTHLAIAPCVAALFGGTGALLRRMSEGKVKMEAR